MNFVISFGYGSKFAHQWFNYGPYEADEKTRMRTRIEKVLGNQDKYCPPYTRLFSIDVSDSETCKRVSSFGPDRVEQLFDLIERL